MTPQERDDFERLLANCANEPIRFPGAIQPHGLLLTLDEPGLRVLQTSANVEDYLGRAPQTVVGQPLRDLVGDVYADLVSGALEGSMSEAPLEISLNGLDFDALLHRSQGVVILELEVQMARNQLVPMTESQTNLCGLFRKLQSAKTLQALYDLSVQEIQALTGYDRVLIYRFEEEGHGQVIAEASGPSMELFNGLFFPASDIPQQARELYRKNWLRIIPNADYQAVPLVPTLRPDTQEALDLGFATLRSVSPIHCQYMKNMGVLSSMSISLLKEGQLWGLISCGNRKPLYVPHSLRMACQTIGQVLSLQISAMEALEVSRQRDEKLEALAVLNQAMADSLINVFDGLAQQPKTLMALNSAGGVAIIEGNQLHRHGNCPYPEEIRELHKWLSGRKEPVFATHNLSGVYPPAEAYTEIASGLLAFSLPKPIDNGVYWFRPEIKESINWSGNPNKPLDLESSETGMRLRPRTSFEIWKVEMAGLSTKWSPGDIFAANDLRRSAIENDLSRQVLREQDAVKARDELVAVVSHDLRNPMTVISMLCGMMQKSFSSDGPHSSRRIATAIDTMQQAAGRMSTLLDDLLDTSKIDAGRYTIVAQKLDVGQIFDETEALLAPLAINKDISISFESEPDLKIHADPERLFQVFSNLVGNAIKFTPRLGSISVCAGTVGNEILFTVKDSGMGIPGDQLQYVFDRYWTKKEGNPAGSGLGLYISQGIVEAHGGRIDASSELGKGTEFRFTIPISHEATN